MANLTIENFWKRRLAVKRPDDSKLVRGWTTEKNGLGTFREAPLGIDADVSEPGEEENASILLVSAPGAVGKSTLARQLAFATGAVYVDLAKADPVGGNTLSGGLVKSGLYSGWDDGTIAVLVDGLDEARFRVTQEAFAAFLSDIATLSKSRKIPTVLFGRTGAIQDAWLLLDGDASILEIGYYGHEDSIDFAEAQLRAIRPTSQHTEAERRAITVLLERLRAQTDSDGDRFAGYAPVLRAVAERVADVGNPAALIAEIEKGEKAVTLSTVVDAIMDRERRKLSGLGLEDSSLGEVLYTPKEQLDHLVARVYGLATPPLPPMSAKDAQRYSKALESWVPEHPFLDGNKGASSAVFEAVISTHALRHKEAAEIAARIELQRGASANPFLSEFYMQDDRDGFLPFLPPQHVGILYSSLRARLALGDLASLYLDAPEDNSDEQSLHAEVEITLARRDAERARVLNFASEQTGVLRLGAYLEDVEIEAPLAKVEIGPGTEAILVAPVSIQAEELIFTTEKVIAEPASKGRKEADIYLEAEIYSGSQITSVPVVRDNVNLSACWPDALNHPWTSFATLPSAVADPRVGEALRRFRKFVISFRSHSKGALARYRHKLEHARMTKGSGRAVLDLLIANKIIYLVGNDMYFLDPVKLGEITGATFADCMKKKFSPKTVEFIGKGLRYDN